MFQYIKRNILRGGASQNHDFGFLADQLVLQQRRGERGVVVKYKYAAAMI